MPNHLVLLSLIPARKMTRGIAADWVNISTMKLWLIQASWKPFRISEARIPSSVPSLVSSRTHLCHEFVIWRWEDELQREWETSTGKEPNNSEWEFYIFIQNPKLVNSFFVRFGRMASKKHLHSALNNVHDPKTSTTRRMTKVKNHRTCTSKKLHSNSQLQTRT